MHSYLPISELILSIVFARSTYSESLSNVRVSMLEIYNDECRDLLHPDIPTRDIVLREDKEGRMFFTGAREEVVPDVSTALRFLERGNIHRSSAETMMNQSSSRSHVSYCMQLIAFYTLTFSLVMEYPQAIFTISIELLEYKVVPYLSTLATS